MRIIVNVSILLLWNGAWVGASWGVKWAAQYPSKLHRLREGQYFFWGDQYPNNLHRNARVQIFSIQSRRAHVPLGCGAQDPEEASGRKSARHRGFSSWEASKEVLCGPDRSQMIFTDSQAIPVLVDQVRVQQAACQCNIDDQTVSARWCPKLLVKVVYPLVN